MKDNVPSRSTSERLVALLDREITPADRARAALHLVDWLGCAAIGRTSEPGRILSRHLDPHLALPLFPGPEVAPEATAFALGSLGSIFEMDDVHRTALLHPGPVIIPAALSAGTDISGSRLLDAIIRGYETMIRIGRAVGPGHYAYFHNTASCGGFGSAAAAGHAAGLTVSETVMALGTAGSMAGGLWQCRNEPVMTKVYHVAETSRRGVAAAGLVAAGLTGPRFILDGPQGFFAAMARDGDPARIVAGSEEPWLIWQTSFKPWPACRHAHATIDAALKLRAMIATVDPAEIESIEVETFRDAIVFCDRPEPKTTHEAKFSLQHAAAVVLAKGRPELADFAPAAIDRQPVRDMRAKVRVRASHRFTNAYPEHFGSAVAITLADGRIVSDQVADAWGDPEQPVGEDDIIAKSTTLMRAAGIAEPDSEALIEAALSLAGGGSLDALKRASRTSRT